MTLTLKSNILEHCFPLIQTLLYPSGCGIALHSHKIKKQELVPLADKGKHLTAIGEMNFLKLVLLLLLCLLMTRESNARVYFILESMSF